MATFEDLYIENSVDVVKSFEDIVKDFLDMANEAFDFMKRPLAGGTMLSIIMALNCDASTGNVLIDNTPIVEVTIFSPAALEKIELATKCEARIRVENQIGNLSTLKEGWDGAVAKAPSWLAIRNARFIVNQLDDSIVSKCSVFASNDSGVYIQGKIGNGKVTLFVNDEKMAYVIKSKDRRISISGMVDEKSAHMLNEGLKLYV